MAKKSKEDLKMTKTLILAGAFALAVSPAFADKVTASDGKSVTVGGKTYTMSGSRTKVTIKGAASSRENVKADMDCTVTGADGGEATAVDCK
jgi:hypothetical protein